MKKTITLIAAILTLAMNSLFAGNTINGKCAASIKINKPSSVVICPGGAVTLTVGGGESYVWSTGDTVSAIAATSAGLYTVTGTDSLGCTGVDSIAIQADTIKRVVITGPSVACTGVPVILTASINEVSYRWSTGATTSSITVSPKSTTKYGVSVIDAYGCSSGVSFGITVDPKIQLFLRGPKTTCDSTLYSLSLKGGTGPYTFLWNAANATVSSPNSSSTSIVWFDNHVGGEVYLTVTDAKGCTASDSLNISPCFIPCGNDSILASSLRADTGLFRRMQAMESAIARYIASHPTTSSISSSAQYIIPVAVHIISDVNDPLYAYCASNSIPYVPYTQVQSAIAALNAAYSNYSAANSGAPFYQTNTQIQFCLAQTAIGTSWTSSSEPGVIRYYGNSPAILNAAHIPGIGIPGTDDILGLTGQYVSGNYTGVLPKEDYLNIYVINNIGTGCSGIEGFAPTPLSAGYHLDGVVIRADVFGDNTGSYGSSFILQPDPTVTIPGCGFNSPGDVFNDGKICVHEVGHYLDLYHPFEPSQSSGNACAGTTSADCGTDGDYCCHTAPCQPPSTNYICGGTVPVSCGSNAPVGDFMYYSIGNCWNYFTDDQTARMQAELNLNRANLFSVSNLINTGVYGITGCAPQIAYSDFFVSPVPACINQQVTFTPVPAPTNTGTSFTWNFGPSSTTVTTATPVMYTYTVAGTYTVTLTVSDGINPAVTSTQTVNVNACSLNPHYIHNTQWYFGQYANIDFSSGVPVPTTNAYFPALSPTQTLFGQEGAAMWSDNTGHPVFFTDGINAWVLGSTTPLYPQPFTTSALIPEPTGGSSSFMNYHTGVNQLTNSVYGMITVPDPADPNPTSPTNFYVFSSPGIQNSVGNGVAGLSYAEIKTGNAPVVTVPSTTLPPTLPFVKMDEECTIVPHCNGTDYWVITYSYTPSAQFYVYLVSKLGVSNTPIVSGPFNVGSSSFSSIKGSPDTKHLAVTGVDASAAGVVGLFDFDNATGIVSNQTLINYGGVVPHGSGEFIGCSFSSNSKELYTSGETGFTALLYAYDLSSNNYSLVGGFSPMNAEKTYMQLGPDNNIYINNGGGTILSEISNPDTYPGGYISNAVDFSTIPNPYNPGFNITGNDINMLTSIPNLIDAIDTTPIPMSLTAAYVNCNTVALDIPCSGGYVYLWNFGDGSTSSAAPPVTHTYPTSATTQTYNATCTLSLPGIPNPNIVLTQTITILAPTTIITGTTGFCQPVVGVYPYSVPNVPATGVTYNWSISPSSAGAISPGSGPNQVNIAWSSTATSATVNVTISIPTSSGTCTSTGVLNVTLGTPPVVTVIPVPSCTKPVCSGSASAVVSGGTAPYTYNWSSGAVTSAVSNLCVGAYSLTVTDANGCTGTTTFTITSVSPSLITVSSSHPSICPGSSTILTASGASTYIWTPGSLVGSSVSVSPPTTTTYTVIGNNGSCTSGATITITVSSPVVTIVSMPACGRSCSGTATASVTGGTAPYTYAWSNGASTSAITGLCHGTYNLTVTDASGCTGMATVTITNVSPPTVTATASSTAVCPGTATTLSASGASTYTWQPGGLSGSSVSVSPTSTTTYTVTGTSSGGCTGTATIKIIVHPSPTLTVTPSTTLCLGTSLILHASGAFSYVWNPGSSTGSSVTVSPFSTTTYTVTGTNLFGCSSTGTVTITINPPPVIIVTPPAPICSGMSTVLTASGAGSYTWNPGGLTGSSVTVSPTSTTTYSITGIGHGGCKGSTTVTVVVNPKPHACMADTVVICPRDSTTISGLCRGGLQPNVVYSWLPTTGLGHPHSITTTACPAVTTTYTLTETNTLTGCTTTGTTTVAVFPSSFTVTGPVGGALCGVSQLYTISPALPSPVIYTWSAGPPSQNGTGTSANVGFNFPGGSITWTVVDPSGVNGGCRGAIKYTVKCKLRKQMDNGSGQDEDTVLDSRVNVYPNPSRTVLNIELTMEPNEVDNMCIYNSLGELVRCETLKNNLTTISTSEFPSGIYYYRIEDINGILIKADKLMIVR